jgi:hypothetical protein
MAQWVPLHVASRLIGLDPSVVSRRAAEGRYGLTRSVPRQGKPEVHVSTKGLELASSRLITAGQIAAARAGRVLPLPPVYAVDNLKGRKPPPIEVIGATVAREFHEPLDLGDCDL